MPGRARGGGLDGEDRDVGVAEEPVERVAVLRERGDAEGGRRGDRERERRAVQHALGDLARRAGQDDRELVAADPCPTESVGRTASSSAPDRAAQDRIARRVAVAVVGGLEVVEVERERAQNAPPSEHTPAAPRAPPARAGSGSP